MDHHELDPLPENIPDLPGDDADEAATSARPSAYLIPDDRTAAWAVRRIAALHQQIDADYATADAEMQRWRDWQAERLNDHERDIARLTAHLEAYYQHLAYTGKLGQRKTYKLPFGKLKMTMSPPVWTHDPPTLYPWAKANHQLRIKKEIDWVTIKGEMANLHYANAGEPGLTIHGEVIPGVTCTLPRRPTFSVELEKKEDPR